MRRRALLAASAAGGGGDVGGGFTADFYFDYCEENFWGITYYERAPDELGIACYNEVVRLLELYGDRYSASFIELFNPQQYGFNVTIEEEVVVGLSYESGAYFLFTYGEYSPTRVEHDGTLFYEY